MSVYPHYFSLVARPGIKGVVTSAFGRVLFNKVREVQAKHLWLGGFPYLHITAEGARALFDGTTLEQRKALLDLCRTPKEVAAIVGIKPGKAIEKAGEDRLAELNDAGA